MGFYFRHANGRIGKIVGFILATDPPLRYIALLPSKSAMDGAGKIEVVLPEEIALLGLEIENATNAPVA